MEPKGISPEALTSYHEDYLSRGCERPPVYDDTAKRAYAPSPLWSCNFSGLPSRSFPSSMCAHGEWVRGKSFLLCDSSSGEDLFCVEVHTGFSGSAPLGTRPGVILHDGTSKSDPILAAAGDESPLGVVIAQLSRSNLIFTPPLEPGKNFVSLDKEKMNGSCSPLYEVVYSFSFEARENSYRGRYEWRKFKEGLGGFRLVRLNSARESPSMTTKAAGEESSDPRSTSFSSSSCSDLRDSLSIDGEIIAVVKWRRFWSGFTLDGYFELNLMGRAKSGELGQRCVVMIVITAARLWHQRSKGRTTKTYNKVADSVH